MTTGTDTNIDTLGRRVQIVTTANGSIGAAHPVPSDDLYYSTAWQVLENDNSKIHTVKRVLIRAVRAISAVESLVKSVLPRTARLDVIRLHILLLHQLHQRFGDELRAIIAANKFRHAMGRKTFQQRLADIFRVHAMLHFDLDALPGELIFNGQNPQLPACISSGSSAIFHKVIRPNVIGKRSLARHTHSNAATFSLSFSFQQQAMFQTQSPHALAIDDDAELTKFGP